VNDGAVARDGHVGGHYGASRSRFPYTVTSQNFTGEKFKKYSSVASNYDNTVHYVRYKECVTGCYTMTGTGITGTSGTKLPVLYAQFYTVQTQYRMLYSFDILLYCNVT
jgi:hypothetical protein